MLERLRSKSLLWKAGASAATCFLICIALLAGARLMETQVHPSTAQAASIQCLGILGTIMGFGFVGSITIIGRHFMRKI